MKKIVLLLIISLTWFSCELPNNGRMAVIDFNFIQPDILREAETSAVPDRIIPLESKTVVVVMYPNFSTDNTLEGTFPIEGEMTEVLAQESTKVLYYNFSSGFSGGSLENIEPGIWNFAVYTFNSTISNLTADDMFNVMTWRIKKNVDIVPGLNLVDLPLKLNTNLSQYSDNSSVFSPQDVTATSPNAYANATSLSETIFISFTNFQQGECRIKYNPQDIFPDSVIMSLYTDEGYLIDYSLVTVSPDEVYLSFIAPGPSFNLIVSARIINSFTSNPLQMNFYNSSDYVLGSPQSLFLNLYTGGV